MKSCVKGISSVIIKLKRILLRLYSIKILEYSKHICLSFETNRALVIFGWKDSIWTKFLHILLVLNCITINRLTFCIGADRYILTISYLKWKLGFEEFHKLTKSIRYISYNCPSLFVFHSFIILSNMFVYFCFLRSI